MDFFKVLCRLCLDRPGECSMFEGGLPGDIELFLGIKVWQISAEESQPHTICQKCYEVIRSAKDLRSIALKNDMRLKYIISHNVKEYSPEKEIFNETYEEDISTTKIIEETSQSEVYNNIPEAQSNTFEKETSPQVSSNKTECQVAVRKDLFTANKHAYSKSEETIKRSNKPRTFSDVLLKPNSTKKKVTEEKGKISLQCSKCGKIFDKWKKFYLHERLHNKSYECPIRECGKKFASKGDLEKHIRVHTGERPYECTVCQKRFTQRGTLKSHLENVHAYKFSGCVL